MWYFERSAVTSKKIVYRDHSLPHESCVACVPQAHVVAAYLVLPVLSPFFYHI